MKLPTPPIKYDPRNQAETRRVFQLVMAEIQARLTQLEADLGL